MSNATTRSMKFRMYVVFFLLMFGFGGWILAHLVDISIIKADYYRGKASTQQLSGYVLKANRGSIFDRTGKVLAQSRTVYDIIISPNDIRDNHEAYRKQHVIAALKESGIAVTDESIAASAGVYDEADEISKALSDILDVDYAKIKDLCDNKNNQYEIIKRKVDKDVVDKINEFKLEKGIGTFSVYAFENTERIYPNDELAANVIGHINFDGNGVYGVEASYDDFLIGVDGRYVLAKDAAGKAMPYEYEERFDPKNGASIYLTLDEVLQYSLEKHLAQAVVQHQAANRATGIIMNPKTGAVLGMATYPSFNPNKPGELNTYSQYQLDSFVASEVGADGVLSDGGEARVEDERIRLAELQKKNKAISELYFPGSVFKVITCASALEEQLVGLNSTFYCAGHVDVSGTVFNCWSLGGHGTSNLTEAITRSCNPAFIAIGQLLGASKFSQYFESFGFTQRTGIDLPGEVYPLYVRPANMGEVELASSAFGQTNKITPIQMITAYAAAVNGGNLVTPYVVERIVDGDGNVIKQTQPSVKRQVISAETSELMRHILEDVVDYNGGTNAAISGYRIGGKSGTTQKIDDQNKELETNPNAPMRYVSTFCAFTPADDPEVIMLVCVDDPRGVSYYGSAVAAPVVSAVFTDTLPYLQIYPQYTKEELALQDAVVPYIKGYSSLDAQTKLGALGLTAEFIGEENGGRVVKTIPEAGLSISKNGKVYVYLSEVEDITGVVPDVTDLSVTQANSIITGAGFNIRLSGGALSNEKAKAATQSRAPGTELAVGSVIEVMFVVNDENG